MPHGNEHIFVVDDKPETTVVMAHVLRGLGYSVTTAGNGTTARDLFSRRPRNFDLILLDQSISGTTGIQLAKRMMRKRRGVPIILVCGHCEAISPEKVRTAGIRASLMKPVTKGEVAETIRKVLDGNRGRGVLSSPTELAARRLYPLLSLAFSRYLGPGIPQRHYPIEDEPPRN